MRALALLSLIVCSLWLVPAPTSAQSLLDYNRLLGGSTAPAEEEPRQSRPVPTFDPASVPSAEEYARIAENYDDSGLNAGLRAIEVFRARLIETLKRSPSALGEVWTTLEAASPTGRPAYFAGIAMFSLLLLTIGRAVTQVVAVYGFRPLFVALQKPNPQGYSEKMPVLAARLGLTVVGASLAIGVASALGLIYYDGHEATLATAAIIFAAYGALLMVDSLWRMVLCPFLPDYRIPAIDGHAARRLYQGLSIVSGFAIATLALCYWMLALGLSRDVHVLMSIMLGGAQVAAVLTVMRSQRRSITAIITAGRARDDLAWPPALAARLWGPLSALYLLGSWVKLSFDLVMGVPTGPEALAVPYVVLIGGLMVFAASNFAIERFFGQRRAIERLNAGSDVLANPFRAGRAMRSFEDLARRVASLIALGAGIWILIYTWGGMAVFGENMVFGILEDLIDIALIGYIAFHAVRIWMDRKIEEEVGDTPEDGAILDGEGGGAGASRLATLLPLVRNFILTIMVLAIALAVASELGFNVAPLFAGAGIVGLAIGFGSQTLVRDILSGAFFLMDDAFRKGEYIDVGEVKGTVEKISLRSFQLRHHLGMLHTIPFGAINHLTNFSRDWVIMKLPLRLTYDTDVERVRKLVKKLGQELLDDPVIGAKFLQPLKSQGVIHMEDSAMIVRVKFMCKPGEQWVIRKRVYQEIRALFEREGVRFAHREVTVRIPDLDDAKLSERDAQAVGAAARQVVEEQGDLPPRIAAVGVDDR
ncbi:MAG: mechanosensitive ion channel family protein [Pseudomonadota bacterium]